MNFPATFDLRYGAHRGSSAGEDEAHAGVASNIHNSSLSQGDEEFGSPIQARIDIDSGHFPSQVLSSNGLHNYQPVLRLVTQRDYGTVAQATRVSSAAMSPLSSNGSSPTNVWYRPPSSASSSQRSPETPWNLGVNDCIAFSESPTSPYNVRAEQHWNFPPSGYAPGITAPNVPELMPDHTLVFSSMPSQSPSFTGGGPAPGLDDIRGMKAFKHFNKVTRAIPQEAYKPPTSNRKKGNTNRYTRDLQHHSSIFFGSLDSNAPTGVPLAEALRFTKSDTGQLKGADDRILGDHGTTTLTVRIQLKDYEKFSKLIRIEDWCKLPNPITRAKLARDVARCVESFLSRAKNLDGGTAEPNSPTEIRLEDLRLHSLHHMSQGSWQPVVLIS